jgi:hypothetical protein
MRESQGLYGPRVAVHVPQSSSWELGGPHLEIKRESAPMATYNRLVREDDLVGARGRPPDACKYDPEEGCVYNYEYEGLSIHLPGSESTLCSPTSLADCDEVVGTC